MFSGVNWNAISETINKAILFYFCLSILISFSFVANFLPTRLSKKQKVKQDDQLIHDT